MGRWLHWIFHALFVLFVCAVIGAFGGGCFWLYRDDTAQRSVAAQVPVLTKALADLRQADADAARVAAARRSADSGDAFRLGVKVGRQTIYQSRATPGVQSETDPHLIRQLLEQE